MGLTHTDWWWQQKREREEREMAHWSDVAGAGQYLRGVDIDGKGDIPVTISHHAIEEMPHDKEKKAVIYFRGSEKGLVLNQTNGEELKDHFGDDMDNWNGKRIVLFTVRTQTPDGTPTKGIRVRCTLGEPLPKTSPVQKPDFEEFSSESLSDGDDLPF